jgi:hypothetical protein
MQAAAYRGSSDLPNGESFGLDVVPQASAVL